MLKTLKYILLSFSVMFFSKISFANDKDTYHLTIIDGNTYILQTNTFAKGEHKKTLQMLEEAISESNRLTTAYLKTNSPAWKDLMTDELKANLIKFEKVWKRIVIDRHYNKDVLDAYEKYGDMNLANWDKMYAHFYARSTNEPFKLKVKDAQRANKNHLINEKAAIRYLRTLI